MIKTLLIVTTVAGVLALVDDKIRAVYHPVEEPVVHEVDRTNKSGRVHLDVWVYEHGKARIVCVMGPCRVDRAAGDMR